MIRLLLHSPQSHLGLHQFTEKQLSKHLESQMLSLRLIASYIFCRLFDFSHGIISPFRMAFFSSFRVASFRLFAWRLFVFKRRNNARREDEKTPSEKTPRKRTTKLKFQNGVISHGVFSSFRAEISSFRVVGFVFSHGVSSSFCMAFFRLFTWRLFAAKRRNGTIQPSYVNYSLTTQD